jgi:hypothetical protein
MNLIFVYVNSSVVYLVHSIAVLLVASPTHVLVNVRVSVLQMKLAMLGTSRTRARMIEVLVSI